MYTRVPVGQSAREIRPNIILSVRSGPTDMVERNRDITYPLVFCRFILLFFFRVLLIVVRSTRSVHDIPFWSVSKGRPNQTRESEFEGETKTDQENRISIESTFCPTSSSVWDRESEEEHAQ